MIPFERRADVVRLRAKNAAVSFGGLKEAPVLAQSGRSQNVDME
jgi:hypothetical protein